MTQQELAKEVFAALTMRADVAEELGVSADDAIDNQLQNLVQAAETHSLDFNLAYSDAECLIYSRLGR